jgi:hypothetical protein
VGCRSWVKLTAVDLGEAGRSSRCSTLGPESALRIVSFLRVDKTGNSI